MSKLLRRLQYLFRRKRIEADLAEEMQFHRDLLAGDSASERAASQSWGNAALAREGARGVWLAPWIESVWQDFAYGVRGLRRQPGFTLVAIGALAIAIGLNTGLFTVFNAIAYRLWPVKDPAHMVNVVRVFRRGPESGHTTGFGVAEWRYLSEHSKAFDGLLLTRNGQGVEADSQPLSLTFVTGSYFHVLGVGMARGRGFRTEEDMPLAPEPVVVLNYATWQNRFGGDPAIIGKTVRLDEIAFSVVGVAPEFFAGTDVRRADLWAPFSARRTLRPHDASALAFLTSIDHCCVSMAGRLAAGYSREQAAAEIAVLMNQLHGKNDRESEYTVMTTGTALLDAAGRDKNQIVPAMSAMFLAVTLILLLACANVGNISKTVCCTQWASA